MYVAIRAQRFIQPYDDPERRDRVGRFSETTVLSKQHVRGRPTSLRMLLFRLCV
jgi:hypothetical protein